MTMDDKLNIQMKELYEKFKKMPQYVGFVHICKNIDPDCTDDQIYDAFKTTAIEQAMNAAFKKVVDQTIDDTIMGTSKSTETPKGMIN